MTSRRAFLQSPIPGAAARPAPRADAAGYLGSGLRARTRSP
jgi:hypothetical protein